MKRTILSILVIIAIACSAQNQVVRRQGTKKETSTASSTNNSSANSKSKTSSSSHTESLPRAARQSISYQTFYVNGVSFQMARVVAGTFFMGATSEERDLGSDGYPRHKVTLTRNYYLGKTEVTQALWKAVMGSNPSHSKGDNKPVESVSWNDCQAFITKLNSITCKNFRLPTEAEWEFAARGGNNSHHYPYCGSSNPYDVAWFSDNSGNTTHNVATKQANELGLYDMSGNVFEWCSDCWSKYSSSSQTNPIGPMSGDRRMNRGGCYGASAWNGCPSRRMDNSQSEHFSSLGFRLALSE